MGEGSKEAMDLILRSLQDIKKDNEDFKLLNQALSDRLDLLETGQGAGSKNDSGGVQNNGGDPPRVVINGSAREKVLAITFGDDESPTALRLFIEHYNLAKEQNISKNIEGWADPAFRANELRLQLRGKVAAWLVQESAMQSSWLKNDEQIIDRLKDRFLGTQSIELNIITFEDLKQNESEGLAEYMTRCQEKGLEAFSAFDPVGVQQRVVWKFLSGIRDPDVRSEVIKAKWMDTPGSAKPYADVLKIAETAKLAKIATAATGGAKVQQPAKIAPVYSKVKEKRAGARRNDRSHHSSAESFESSDSRRSSLESSGSGQKSVSENFVCHYCNKSDHYGGWRNCERRKKEDPTWKPGF